ncbi:MAG: universal stress protein [Phyllobacterium sp.]|uniref:universal stress protein n=1 Tax=Phyllobacterium sp. TaxID=1871046 RepID=UPI0030F1547D
MSYRTILVNFNIDGPVAPLMDFAINLAARFNSHLIGFTAAGVVAPTTARHGILIDNQTMGREREEIDLRMKILRREFESLAGTHVSHEWREAVVNPTSLLIEMSRVADLVITGPDEVMTLGHSERCVNLGDVVLEAGRPVLVAAKDAKRIFTNTALIAWKDTREARRAVVDALPLLCQANDVVVATVADDADTLTQESLDDVVTFLHRHGVKALSKIIEDKHESESLLTFARSIEAELIISGAYGHSRVREMVFGGVTRSLLAEGNSSRFLSS